MGSIVKQSETLFYYVQIILYFASCIRKIMEQFGSISDLKRVLREVRKSGLTIGFVPTMGALHDGHLSLVRNAAAMCDKVVVSVFVNPTQFNDPNDLKNYPRTLDKDSLMLSKASCHYLFVPSVSEIYPEPDTRIFEFGSLGEIMEGRYRPGHFNGVAQVVSKLFEIVAPDKAFFGLKDFQQLAVIRKMVNQLKFSIEIVACDIIREPDGLAMSSRNALLTLEYRRIAPLIYDTLKKVKLLSGKESVASLKQKVISDIDASGLLKVEYFEIVDDKTLQPISNWETPGTKVGCIAVSAGNIRLIDNIIFEF